MKSTKTLESNRLIHAITFGITASLCYSVMILLVKSVSSETTEAITVFFRFTVSLFWVISVLIYKKLRGKTVTLKTKHFGIHILRAVCGFIAMLSLYYALRYVPLVDANSLAMTYALFIPILGALFFKTKTNTKNWLALIIGFIGIIFILKPYSGSFNPMALMALITGFSTALVLLGIYKVAKDDHPYTIMLYYFPLSFVISGIFILFNWTTPSFSILISLLLIGITGTAYQEFLTRSMLYAPPKTVAPFLYFSMVFSGFFDWIFWGYIPDLYFWIGLTLVVLGCWFSIRYTKV